MQESKKALYEIIRLNGRDYITSHNLYEHYQDRYTNLANFNAMIKNLKEFKKLLFWGGHIQIIDKDSQIDGNCQLQSLIKANSYNPVMLLDPVAQKTIETALSSEKSLQANADSAVLRLSNIETEYLEQEDLDMLRTRAIARKTKALAEQNKARIEQLERKFENVPTEEKITAIAQVASMNLIGPEDFKNPVMSRKQMQAEDWAKGMNDEQISKFLHWCNHPMETAQKNDYAKDYKPNAFPATMFLTDGLKEKFIKMWDECKYLKLGKKHHYLKHQFLNEGDSYFLVERNKNKYVEKIYDRWLISNRSNY